MQRTVYVKSQAAKEKLYDALDARGVVVHMTRGLMLLVEEDSISPAAAVYMKLNNVKLK